MTFIKRVLIAIAVFGSTYLISRQTHYFDGFDININSWGWVVFVATAFCSIYAQAFAFRILTTADHRTGSAVWKSLDTVFNWLVGSIIFLITTLLVPRYASCTSAIKVVVLSVGVGLASATCDRLCDIFAPNPGSRQ